MSSRDETGGRDLLELGWDRLRPRLARRWQRLSSQDLHRVAGSRTGLEALLQETYGVGRAEARRQLGEFLDDAPEHRPPSGI